MQNTAHLLSPMDEDDEQPDAENSIYFTNEEKIISNSLLVNFASQLIIIVIFTFAASLADWTHITVTGTDSEVYHITLVTMKIGTTFDDFNISGDKFEWLMKVSEECNELTTDEPYPEEVCRQSRSLYVSGFVVSIVCDLINIRFIDCFHPWYRNHNELIRCSPDLEVR